MGEFKEGEPKPVEGYVIMSGEKHYLGVGMRWFDDQPLEEQVRRLVWTSIHTKPEEARVFDLSTVEAIKKSMATEDWHITPSHAIPATWSERGGVKVIGEKVEFGKIKLQKED